MTAPDRAQAITETVHRYIELADNGGAEEIADLYAVAPRREPMALRVTPLSYA